MRPACAQVEFPHNLFPDASNKPLLFYTPADWAWIGGLLDVLLPSLYYGVPVLAHRAPKFTGADCFALMQEYQVRHAFLPPTALKMMRQVLVRLECVFGRGSRVARTYVFWWAGQVGQRAAVGLHPRDFLRR